MKYLIKFESHSLDIIENDMTGSNPKKFGDLNVKLNDYIVITWEDSSSGCYILKVIDIIAANHNIDYIRYRVQIVLPNEEDRDMEKMLYADQESINWYVLYLGQDYDKALNSFNRRTTEIKFDL